MIDHTNPFNGPLLGGNFFYRLPYIPTTGRARYLVGVGRDGRLLETFIPSYFTYGTAPSTGR